MSAGRREVRALCAAVRVALAEVDRQGMLTDDAPESCLAAAERWARDEGDAEGLREALETMRPRVEAAAERGGDEAAPALLTLHHAVDCLLRAARDVTWDDDAKVPRDAVLFWVESTLELTGEGEDGARARATLAWAAALDPP